MYRAFNYFAVSSATIRSVNSYKENVVKPVRLLIAFPARLVLFLIVLRPMLPVAAPAVPCPY